MKKMILLVAVFFPVWLLAKSGGHILDDLRTKIPTASEYEIFQNFYDSISEPAQLADFDVFGEVDTFKCAFASEYEKEKIQKMGSDFKRYEYREKGTQENGPLFPGIPDKVRPILIGKAFEQSQNLVEGIASITTLQIIDHALEVSISGSAHGLDEGELPIRVSFRKNEQLITFKGIHRVGQFDQETMFGYCWKF